MNQLMVMNNEVTMSTREIAERLGLKDMKQGRLL